jgi:hypothetical protein
MALKRKVEVRKTKLEKKLHSFYMNYIKMPGVIPLIVVEQFKMDSEEIRKENPLYNKVKKNGNI